MSAGAPWSVKGIDPKAREVAKELARRSGMTLGEWLNRVILEDEDPEQLAFAAQPPQAAAHDLHTSLALHGVEHSVRQAVARMDGAADAQVRLGERVAGLEARFETLAAGLARDVEAVRADFAARLAAPPPSPNDARLAELATRIKATERYARDSIDRIGREVIAMAEAVNRRLAATEERGAEAIDQVGTEIGRIAGAVEARLARAEHAQAEALQRLNAEVSRVTERFAERLDGAERRSAEAIQGVGEQVSRLTERLEQRHHRTAEDLAERIRQSEVRTASILESASRPAMATKAPVEAASFARAEAERDAEEASAAQIAQAFAPDDFAVSDEFAPLTDADDDIFTAEILEDPVDKRSPLSTREVIEQARARAAQHSADRASEIPPKPALDVRARIDRQASGRLFSGFGPARPRRAAGGGLHTALMVAGGAAFLSVGAAGVVLMEGEEATRPGPVAYGAPGAHPRVAVALAPSVAAPTGAPSAVTRADTQAAYTEAVRAIALSRPGGLASLKTLAEQGYAPAQLHLAGLYETGGAGVIPNPREVRRWTALAAEGGSPRAMHNLAVYFFHGEGGPKDLASAAQWFHKAAELGVVESQYNLGMMYQSGSGVRRDLAEARKWFDMAAVQGDAEARRAADALAPRPEKPGRSAANSASAAGMNIPATKRALAQLGYYNGPLDTEVTPAYKAALADYQRDQAGAVAR